ncbi:MAG: hypothetical protein WCA08_23505 [Desulfoferrobacter sp.]
MTRFKDSKICGAMELARGIIWIADQLENECPDDTCLLTCGIVKDSAYRIRKVIQERFRCMSDFG